MNEPELLARLALVEAHLVALIDHHHQLMTTGDESSLQSAVNVCRRIRKDILATAENDAPRHLESYDDPACVPVQMGGHKVSAAQLPEKGLFVLSSII